MEIINENKESLIKKINESSFDQQTKDFLTFFINTDSNFIHYAFGHGSIANADWDYAYANMKHYFIQVLLKTKWEVSYGDTYLHEYAFIVLLEFKEEQLMDDFLMSGRLEEDSRTVFNQIEIFLNKHDLRQAFEKGLIKNSEHHTWSVD